MLDETIPASEARERFAELLEQVEHHRVIVTKHGQEKAFLIAVRELRALEETLAVLENSELMRGLRQSLDDLRAGRVTEADQAFAQIEAELGAGE